MCVCVLFVPHQSGMFGVQQFVVRLWAIGMYVRTYICTCVRAVCGIVDCYCVSEAWDLSNRIGGQVELPLVR